MRCTITALHGLRLLAGTLALSAVFSTSPAAAQQSSAVDDRALDLVVMITGELAGEPTAGAGIVFGGKDGQLFIVTANHVVRRARHAAGSLQVQFRTLRDMPLSARLTSHFDSELDLAVLAVDGADRRGLDICDFPRTLLGHPDSLVRGAEVYPVGHPNGVEWAAPVAADRLAEVRGDLLTFQSVFIARGHSGGALLTGDGRLVGLIREDQPPFGRALHMGKVIEVLRGWGYPVQLHAKGALHQAAREARVDEMRFLLASGCGIVRERDGYWGDTPMHQAVMGNHLDALQLLVEHGADVNDASDLATPLYYAAHEGLANAVNGLLTAGADPNANHSAGSWPTTKTPLQVATRGGTSSYWDEEVRIDSRWESDVEIVRALLKAGANVNGRQDSRSMTPLSHAVGRGHIQMVKLLLEAGADVNISSSEQTPLHLALEYRRIEIARLLIEAGADLNARDDRDRTPLAIIRTWVEPDEEIISLLLERGARQ
jgi:hypothetical protein